jgi:hypothetical protein
MAVSEQPALFYVDGEGVANLVCTSCGQEKQIHVSRFKGRDLSKPFAITCVCGERTVGRLEFRKHYRKPVSLPGNFSLVANPNIGGPVQLRNLSQSGAGFTNLDLEPLKVGDVIVLDFVLDDLRNSNVQRQAVVRLVRGDFVGVEFTPGQSQDRNLGYYLLNCGDDTTPCQP